MYPRLDTTVNTPKRRTMMHTRDMIQTNIGGGTVGKAFEVLDQVATMDRPVRFTELLAQSQHPKATLYRLVQTLAGLGLLAYDGETQTYTPGLRLVRLAHSAWKHASLAPLARPALDRLADITGETVHLAQLEKGQVLYVDKRKAAQPIDLFSQAGKVGPGYCTGIGKAMIAFLEAAERDQAIAQQSFYRYTPSTLCSAEALRADLERVREEGFAWDREEHEPGIICIAVPILSRQRVVGGLSVTTATNRHDYAWLDSFKPQLAHTAASIAADAEDWLFPRAS